VDWATRVLAQTFVISAGNNPSCGVGAPGIAFSVITVGSQFDNNNGGWAGDGMSAFSAATEGCVASGNCTSDFEKPEVVAVGQDIRSTNNTGGVNATGVNGTSFSAPQVTGQVASMLNRKPCQNTWPETNKAAVLVSAYHDIVAGREQDGVGSVVMNNSDDTYRFNRFLNSSASCASFSNCAGPFNRLHDNLISVPSTALNKPMRVAISWDADSNGSTIDRQGADIDLCVRNPSNVIIACSSSFGNTWEMVEFTPTVAGAYDVSLTLFNCPGYPGGSVAERCSAGALAPSWPGTFYGVAWSFREIPDICSPGGSGGLTVLPSTGVPSLAINNTNGWTFFDSYPTSAFNQSGREAVFQLTITAPRDLRATDTNGSLDLHWVRITSCSTPTITALASGINIAQVNDAPAGTYHLIVDGFNGAVGSTALTVSVLPTTTFGAEAAELSADEKAEQERRK
jgi:hypothetical protein